MTNDKTVTMSRDLAERVQSALLSSHCPEQFLLNELQRAIAAPIVEADGMGEAVLLGTCDVPPPGWVCSRGKGHEGPCAASQAPVQQKKENFTYSSNQATNCAGCSNHKHTPLRVDAMGGYVCLTCIYNELDRLLIEESARHAEPDWQGCQEISDLPRVHEVLQAFSADPTEDNGIAVVQAIVKATTRPVQE